MPAILDERRGTYHGREGEDGYPPSWMREGGLTMVGKGRMVTRHLGLNGGTYHGREGADGDPSSWIEWGDVPW